MRHVYFYLHYLEYYLCGNNTLWTKLIFALKQIIYVDKNDLFHLLFYCQEKE